MRLIDYLNLARDRWVVVLGMVIASSVAVLGITLQQAPAYSASSRVRLSLPVAETDIVVREIQADVNTEAELVKSSQVAAAVAAAIGYLGRPDELLDRLSVSAVPNTAVVQITATDTTDAQAVTLANTFAAKFVEVRQATLDAALSTQGQQLSQQQVDLQNRHAKLTSALSDVPTGSPEALALQVEQSSVLTDLVQLRSRLDSLARIQVDARNRYEIIREARDAATVRSTSLNRALVFGVLIGLPLALAVILLLDSLSNAIRGRDDVERHAGTEVLGIVPYDRAWVDEVEPRLAVVVDALSPVADAYRTLGHNVSRLAAAQGAQTILVTSPGGGDGKTSVAVNLAVVSSDAARRTLLVEADLRHPRAHAFLGASPQPGVTDVLAGGVELVDAVKTIGPDLEFFGAGSVTDRPDLLVGRSDIERLLSQLLDREGPGAPRTRPLRVRPSSISPILVIIDSSSVLNAVEVSSLAAAVDAVLLVTRVGVTSRQAVRAAAEQIRRAGGVLLGAVVIGAKSMADTGWSPQGERMVDAVEPGRPGARAVEG